MKLCFFFFLFILPLGTMAFGGTVVKVLKKKEIVVIKLTKKELKKLSAGDEVQITVDGNTADAELQKISGTRGRFYITFGIDSFSKGARANIEPRDGETVEEGPPSKAITGPLKNVFNPFWGTSTTRNRTEHLAAGLIYLSLDSKISSESDQFEGVADVEASGPALGVNYRLPEGPVISLAYSKTELQVSGVVSGDTLPEDIEIESKSETSEIILGVGVPVTKRFALNASYIQTSNTEKTDDEDAVDISYTRFRPGILFYTKTLELSLVHHPKIHIVEDDISEKKAPGFEFNLHHMVGDKITKFGLGYSYHSVVDDEDKNGIEVEFGYGAEPNSGMTWAFGLGYTPAYYRDKEEMSSTNIGKTSVMLDGGFRKNQWQFAVGVNYDFVKDKEESDDETSSETELETQSITVIASIFVAQ
jgi:predicted porin